MESSYYTKLNEHCNSIGVKLRTPYALFSSLIRTQPTKRTLDIELGCHHGCIMTKQAWDIFNMKSGLCRMCQNSDLEELAQLAQEDIANGELTQDQLEELDEDYCILACLRAKAKKNGFSVGDLVDIWLDQDGKCKECECQLYPTASTRSFYFQEEEVSDLEDLDENIEPVARGVFLCPLCKL